MMGRSHGLSGLTAGLGVGAATGARPEVCLLLGGVTLLGAYWPDIDHRNSTVTRSVPIIGRVASLIVRVASRWVYAATKGSRDENHKGEHRHLSHTVIGALIVGSLFGLAVFAGLRRIGIEEPQPMAVLLGAGFALGCFVHCLGDALTLSGCPFLWPIPILGETWYELRPPRLLRFRTGGPVENYLVVPALVITTFLLIPGVWPLVGPWVLDAGHSAIGTPR